MPATLPKPSLVRGCFSRFLNCVNGNKSRKASQMLYTIVVLNQSLCVDTWHNFVMIEILGQQASRKVRIPEW